ncbi:MAG: tRNA-dihydrouridine synthase [Methanobacteriota archaeon]
MSVQKYSFPGSNPFVQAPMSGITDRAFRTIARRFHRGLIYTEMISAEALCRGDRKTLRMAVIDEEHKPCALQLIGPRPDRLAEAARIAEGLGAEIIDINAACPEPKVVKAGAGGALMKDLGKLDKAVRAVVDTAGVPVSVKLRLGYDRDVSSDALALVAEAGAAYSTFHGRLVSQGFTGKSDWNALKRLAGEARMPFLANGDARNEASAVELLRFTGATGVMLGRATRGRPDLPGAAFDVLEGRPTKRLLGDALAFTILDHAKLLVEERGEHRGICRMRKHIHWYLASAGAKFEKERVHRIETVAELERFLDDVEWRNQ